MTDSTFANGPLSDLRVLELGTLLAGPFCGQLLGDLGAEVIKIEPPGQGDPMRVWGRQQEGEPSLWWPVVARNKKAITLDLRQPEGRELLLRLAERADAVVENFRGGWLAAQGLGAEVFHARNPRLVIASLSGFGSHGPRAGEASYDIVAQASNAMLLIDTYDTVEGARRVAEIAPRLAARGIRIKGVRLDSGDLDALAREVRRVLDEAGLREAIIFASGNLDEHRVHKLIAAGAPSTSFGVGTSLTTSSDAAYLDAVYKLQEYAGQARRKRSAGKATWPGRKQVYRAFDANGRCAGDTVALASETCAGEPLLFEVMRSGRRIAPSPPLAAARARCAAQLAALPPGLRALAPPWSTYPVTISPAIRALADEIDQHQLQPMIVG